MAKRARNAAALKAELTKRINAIREVVDDDVKLEAPRPEGHERDKRGRNWDMKIFRNAAGYERQIRVVVDKARDEFDLDESAATAREWPGF